MKKIKVMLRVERGIEDARGGNSGGLPTPALSTYKHHLKPQRTTSTPFPLPTAALMFALCFLFKTNPYILRV